jgi:hypothetical protein
LELLLLKIGEDFRIEIKKALLAFRRAKRHDYL